MSDAARVARRAMGTVPCDTVGLAMTAGLAAAAAGAACVAECCGGTGAASVAAGVFNGLGCTGCAALAEFAPGAVVMRRVGAAACVLKRPEVGALRLILRCTMRMRARVESEMSAFDALGMLGIMQNEHVSAPDWKPLAAAARRQRQSSLYSARRFLSRQSNPCWLRMHRHRRTPLPTTSWQARQFLCGGVGGANFGREIASETSQV